MKKLTCLTLIAVLTLFVGIYHIASAAGAQSGGYVLPILKRDSLLNGLQLILLEKPGAGTVAVRLRINSGAMFDLAGKGGLADATAGMLLRGGGGYTAKDFREAVSQLGVTINISAGWDSTDITASGPSYALEGIFDLLGRMVITPAFDQKEFDQLKAERIEAVKQEQAGAAARAQKKAVEAIYGSHPYGRPARGTAESLAKIVRADLLYFHNRFYIANNSELMIIGEAKTEEMTRFARSKLGAWKKGDKVPADFRPPGSQSSRQVFILDQAESDSAQAVIAQMGISRRVENYFATMIMFDVLKQRLSKYGEQAQGAHIEATLEARFLSGPLLVQTSAPAVDLTKTIEAVFAEMLRMQSAQPPLDQVEGAKARIIAGFADRLKETEKIFDLILDVDMYGLGRDYLVNFEDRVNAVTPADVQRAAQNHLKPQSSTIAVAGPASRFESLLKNIGSVTVMP